MRFLIITQVVHKEIKSNYFASGPYVREINQWIKYVNKVTIVAPLLKTSFPEPIEMAYKHEIIEFISIPQFNIKGVIPILRTCILMPILLYRITQEMIKADHIHIRCPGNIGLVGCFVQILFPSKRKTAKYAGNWDWESKQPWSYRLQQKILRNAFLTRNMTALVYGEWPDRTRNIKSFFTASYSENERITISKVPLSDGLKLAFVGTLTENKAPLLSLEVLKSLTGKGIKASLTLCGDGPQQTRLEQKITEYGLENNAILFGNVGSEKVKEVLKVAHFLIFISRSEGWPKAVSEAMWWGCIPVTTPVSCVPWMLDSGSRGELVSGSVSEITSIIEGYIMNQTGFDEKSAKAMEWAREYTLEKFESEVKKLLQIENPSAYR